MPAPLFTDGAVEGQQGEIVTMGAVLVDQTTNTILFRGCHCHVPSIWDDRWRESGKEQVICEAEVLPFSIVQATLAQQLCKPRDIRSSTTTRRGSHSSRATRRSWLHRKLSTPSGAPTHVTDEEHGTPGSFRSQPFPMAHRVTIR